MLIVDFYKFSIGGLKFSLKIRLIKKLGHICFFNFFVQKIRKRKLRDKYFLWHSHLKFMTRIIRLAYTFLVSFLINTKKNII